MTSFTEMLNNQPASSLTDEDVMLALQQGQSAALNELMRRYKEPLFGFVVRYTRHEDVAYDIVQEAFFKVYKRAETYKPSFPFKSWLYRITMNLCHDYARQKKLQSLLSLDTWFCGENDETLHNILPSAENVESLTEHRQELKILDKEIDKLPHKLKTALILFALEDRSQEECARILDVTPKTVEMRVYRARKILLQKLSEII